MSDVDKAVSKGVAAPVKDWEAATCAWSLVNDAIERAGVEFDASLAYRIGLVMAQMVREHQPASSRRMPRKKMA